MASVRLYNESDKERVQQICLDDAGCANASDDTKKYILTMYCNYYIEQEPDNCFVALNNDGEIIGYALCSEDYDTYEKVFSEKYLPQTAAISAKRYVDAKMDMLTHSMFRDSYKSHIHINIDVNYQRQGVGSLLLSTVKSHMRKKRVDSIMLVCDNDNEGAIEFYTKNGFNSLMATKFGLAMGLKFNAEDF